MTDPIETEDTIKTLKQKLSKLRHDNSVLTLWVEELSAKLEARDAELARLKSIDSQPQKGV